MSEEQSIYSIVRLKAQDTARLRAVLALFAEAFEEPETYLGKIPEESYLARFLSREHVIVLAALVEEKSIGALVAYELEKFEQQRSEIYIYDLAVAQSHRRQGIATAMINTLKQLAADRGAWVVFVQADYGDDPAIALYTKLGNREDVLHFDIAVKSELR